MGNSHLPIWTVFQVRDTSVWRVVGQRVGLSVALQHSLAVSSLVVERWRQTTDSEEEQGLASLWLECEWGYSQISSEDSE